jgi:hypothetical protein
MAQVCVRHTIRVRDSGGSGTRPVQQRDRVRSGAPRSRRSALGSSFRIRSPLGPT